jgi:hypothetical protein
MSQQDSTATRLNNGSAAAAFLAGGIGGFVMGLITLLTAHGVVTVPVIYGPVGGLSGRSTIAVLVWLMAWGGLHLSWNRQQVDLGKIFIATLILTVLGLLGTVPPYLVG